MRLLVLFHWNHQSIAQRKRQTTIRSHFQVQTINMHFSKSGHTRSFSIDPLRNGTRIGFQSNFEHFLTNQGFRAPDIPTPSNHAVPQNRAAVEPPLNSAANTSPGVENKFRHMSRTELEIFTHTVMLEANEYKYHFNELQKKCNLLQTSVDEVKRLYAETYKKSKLKERVRIENVATARALPR